MPPALRGLIRDAIRRQWPTIIVRQETDNRDSSLIIEWYGREYRLTSEDIR